MAITNTVEGQLAAMGFNSANWVPEHEPYGNIITQRRFAFIAMLGNDDIDPKANFGKTKIKRIPGLIKSSPSGSMNPKIDQYLELPTSFTINGAITGWVDGTAKNVTFDSTGGLKKYDNLRDKATGSVIQVVSVTSSTVASCKPFAGGSNSDGTDNIADNATMEFIGSAYKDAATYGEGFRSTPAQNSNYMQINVEEYGIGLVEDVVKKYPGENNQLMTRRELARIRMNQGREACMLFGEKIDNETVDSTAHIYGAAGLLGFSSAEYDAGGSLTLDEWNQSIMPQVTQYGGGDFHAMCGGTVLGVWASMAADQIRTSQSDRLYGNKVMRVQTNVEEVVLHGTSPMNQRPGEMLMFQPDLIERKYFPKFNSVHVENIAARNTMKKVNGYICVECIIPRNEDVISLVTGVLA